MSGNSGGKFKTGDLVFAKMKGFPYWPARVCKSDNGYKKRVPIFYFGTHQVGNVPPENVVPFNGNKTKYGSGVRIKGFSEGMWEIQNTPGICSKVKLPEKQPPGKQTPAKKTPIKPPAKSALTKSAPPKLTSRKAPISRVTASLSKTPSRASRSAEERPSDDDQKSTQTKAADTAKGPQQQREISVTLPLEEGGKTSTAEGEEKSPVVKSRKAVKNEEGKDGGNNRRTRSHGDQLNTDEVQPTKRRRRGKIEVYVDENAPEHIQNKEKTQNTLGEEKGKTEEVGKIKTDLESEETEKTAVSLDVQVQGTKRKKEEMVEKETPQKSDIEKTQRSDEDEPQKAGQDSGIKKKRVRRLQREEPEKKKNEDGSDKINKTKEEMTPQEKILHVSEEEKSSSSLDKTEPDTDQRAREEIESGMTRTVENIIKHKEEKINENIEGESEKQDLQKRKTRSGRTTEKTEVGNKTSESVTSKKRRGGKGEEKKTEKVKMTRRGTRSHHDEMKKEEEIAEKELSKKDEENGQVEENNGRKSTKLGRREPENKKVTPDEKPSKRERTTTKNAEKGGEKKTEMDELSRMEMRSESEASPNRSKHLEMENKVDEEKLEPKKMEDNKTKRESWSTSENSKPQKKRRKDAGTSSESEQFYKTRGKEAAPEKKSSTKKDQDEGSREETQSETEGKKRRRKDIDKTTPVKEKRNRKADVLENLAAGGKPEKPRDEERQALKRERLLKSLQGLMKSKRGSRRREAAKNLQKAAVSRKKSMKNLSSKRKWEKSERNKGGKAPQAKVEAEKTEEKPVEVQMKEKPEVDQKEGHKSTNEKSDGHKLGERKIIGKIVKAGHGGKIQVKTMMGGIMALSEKKKDGKMVTTDMTEAKVEKRDIIGKLERNVNGKRRLLMHDGKEKAKEVEKPTKQLEEKPKEQGKMTVPSTRREKPAKEEGKISSEMESQKGVQEVKKGNKSGYGTSTSDERMIMEDKISSPITPTDSTLHRIHGDIQISLKSDKPDIHKCLEALDQLSLVYVTSQHIKRHSELIATLRKMQHNQPSQTIMDKASMLYNRFKNAFLEGKGEEVVSADFLRSLIKRKEREEDERVKLLLQKETTVLGQETELKMEGEEEKIEKGMEEERLCNQVLVEVQE